MEIFNLWNCKNRYVQRTPTDVILEIVTVILLVCLWGFAIYLWNVLPEQIPIHYDLAGDANEYGNKSLIFVIMAITTLTVILTGASAYNLKMINLPIKINSPKQYALISRMSRVVNIVLVFLFFSILLKIASTGLGLHSKLINCFVSIITILLFLVIGFYTFLVYKAKSR